MNAPGSRRGGTHVTRIEASQILAIFFTLLVLVSGVAIVTATVSGQAAPSDPPSSNPTNEIASYSSGSTTIDVSNRSWVYVEVAGNSGEDSIGDGGAGGIATGWINVSNRDQITIHAASGRTGYDDGNSISGFGGYGGGSSAITLSGAVLIEGAGGGGGGGGQGDDGASGGGAIANGGSGGNGCIDSNDCTDGGPGGAYTDSSVLYGETNSGGNGGTGYVTLYEPGTSAASITDSAGTDGELTVNVSDEDFTYPWDESVNVSFYIENDDEPDEYIGSNTVNEPGETTVTYENNGVETWYVETNDSYGFTSTSSSFTYAGNSVAEVRNEQTGGRLDSLSANLTAFGDNGNIYTIETDNGLFDISELPDQSYTLRIEADGYVTRNRYVNSPSDISDIYLLEDSVATTTARFTLDDTTGTYTSASILRIDRPIDTGNGTQYRPIVADSFGTEGLSVELESDQRYRVTIESQDGITQVLGPYRGTLSETVTISPGTGTIEIEREGAWSAGSQLSGSTIHVAYHDDVAATDSVSITIFERGNEDNVLIDSDTFESPSNLSAEYQVPKSENATNWIVQIEVERDGEITTVAYAVGPNPSLVPTNLDPLWQKAIGVVLLLTFGLSFSVLNRAVGAIALGSVGGMLWWIGWLAGATAAVVITAYLFIAVVYGIYTKSIR